MTSPLRIPVPDFLSGRKDIPDGYEPWDVQRLAPGTGGRTNVEARKMLVPYGDDDHSNAVRAHELMHARISPAQKEACMLFGLPPEMVEAGEEFRVNTMLGRAGFNVDDLLFGNERASGARCASNDDWHGMVYWAGTGAGTARFTEFVKGVASVNKSYAAALKELNKALVSKASKLSNEELADTTPSKTFVGVPRGFTRYTRMFAEMLSAALELRQDPIDANGEPVDVDMDEVIDANKIKSKLSGDGRGFARMILDTSVVLDRRLSGKLGRKKIASDTGRNPRRLDRMMTDPHRRVFDRYSKGLGGVVLIDQSGSMRLSESGVMAILEVAPGCVIIGYSHQPGSTDVPNVWVLADRGKVTSTIPEGNGGNGVDGPALRFAQSKRKTGEPFVWICDGLVTDGKYDTDHPELDNECAGLVIKHGIHMVDTTSEAIAALKRCGRGEKLKARATGNVGYSDTWKRHS